jgi:hypothetical protein
MVSSPQDGRMWWRHVFAFLTTFTHSKCRHHSTKDTNLHIMVISMHTKFVKKNIVTEWMKTMSPQKEENIYMCYDNNLKVKV